MKKYLIIILLLLICFSYAIFAVTEQEPQITVFKNVRLFDGEKVIPSTTVIINEGFISTVSPTAAIPAGAEIIDGQGKTLLPGFFDAHVHIWSPQNLQQALIFGVTTVFDMYMDLKTMATLKAEQLSGKFKDRAFLLSPGILCTSPGGHGTQYAPIPTLSTPEEAADFVSQRVQEGSDFLKIIWDDGSAYNMPRPTLDRKTIAAIIQAAHKQNKMVVIHAATQQNCIDSLQEGVDGLAHLFFNNAFHQDFGRMAAKQKAFVIPTLTVLESMNGLPGGKELLHDPALSSYLVPNDKTMLSMLFPITSEKGAYAAAEKAVNQLKTANVPILAGTDAPNPGTTFGASLHRELELLVKAGLAPLEALRSATSIPAQTFKLADRGKIKPGYIADLVLVKGDPTKDIKHSRQISGVWKSGEKIDRLQYLAHVKEENSRLEKLKDAPPPPNSESGWISDFEGEKITAHFGAGWSISTDQIMGGKSEAEYKLVKDGAQGSQGSLLITGIVTQDSATPWAGAFFSPGPTLMAPANLSFKKSINFWAKGSQKTNSIMIFAQSLGFMPAALTFKTGQEWQEYTFYFEQFNVEGYDIMGIFLGGSSDPGEFSLQIDNVRLK